MAPSVQPKTALCAEKQRLLAEYSFAISEYGRTVDVLRVYLGILGKQEYESIRDFTDECRRRSEEFREALAHHTGTHGC